MAEFEPEPREVVLPEDFAAALKAHPQAGARFAALPLPSRRRYVLELEGAGTPEDRALRIERAIARLVAL